MRGREGDRAAVADMQRYAADALAHTARGRGSMDDQVLLRAVLWELAIIGEAANRTSKVLRDAHPEVRWAQIVAQRNILVHAYDEVNVDRLWDAVDALPQLQSHLGAILEELGEP